MSNMSYCRFENTLSDLRDCRGAFEDEEAPTMECDPGSSEHEHYAMLALLRECLRTLQAAPDDALEAADFDPQDIATIKMLNEPMGGGAR